MDEVISKPLRKRGYCGNCDKYGHVFKNCRKPITSFGLVVFKIDLVDETLVSRFMHYANIGRDMTKRTVDVFDNRTASLTIDDDCVRYNRINDIEKLYMYKDHVKFLLIRRRNTLGYIEFIRGRYQVEDVEELIKLFENMTEEEMCRIDRMEFDKLWDELWISSKGNKTYEAEYEHSRRKFYRLKHDDGLRYNLDFYTNNVFPRWESPEWGFPKGRRNFHEKNVACACREFNEETGFTEDDYVLMDKLHPLDESFRGGNKVNYKHVYYVGMSTSDVTPTIDPENQHQVDEIGDIGWFPFEQAISLLTRPHHSERKKILTNLYLFILNDLINGERINRIMQEEEDDEEEEDLKITEIDDIPANIKEQNISLGL